MTIRRNTALSGVAALALLLGGCGGNDGEQRKAFIGFLQTRILDKPGLHVPQLTDEQKTAFGRYADQYAIITDFNKAMDESVSSKLSSAMSQGSITSLEDVSTHKPQLEAAKATIDAMNGALGDDLAKADAAHGKLDQPTDVKAPFDKAYDRLVTRPAAAFKSVVPLLDRVLGQSIELGSYIDQHRGSLQVHGSLIQTSDPAIRAAITDRLRTLQGSQQEIQAAQARMQSVVDGGS